jgi:hypothetical protein
MQKIPLVNHKSISHSTSIYNQIISHTPTDDKKGTSNKKSPLSSLNNLPKSQLQLQTHP